MGIRSLFSTRTGKNTNTILIVKKVTSSENLSKLNSQVISDLRKGIAVPFGLMISLMILLSSFVAVGTYSDTMDRDFGIALVVMIGSSILSIVLFKKQSEYIVIPRLKTFVKFYDGFNKLDIYIQINNQGKKNKAVEKIEKIIDMIELWDNENSPNAFLSDVPKSITTNLKEGIIPTIKNANIKSDATKKIIENIRDSILFITQKLYSEEPSNEDWNEFNTKISNFTGSTSISSKEHGIPLSTISMILMAVGPILGYAINPMLIEKGTAEGDALFNSIVIALAWMAIIAPFMVYLLSKKK